MAGRKLWSPRDRVLYALRKGRMNRTDLLHRTMLTARELDAALEELTKDKLVRATKGAGRRGAPTTWIELVQ